MAAEEEHELSPERLALRERETWEKEPGIVRAYLFDVELRAKYDALNEYGSIACLLCVPFVDFSICACLPCVVYSLCVSRRNGREKALAHHVALSDAGVEFKVDYYLRGMRCPIMGFCEVQAERTLIRYEDIHHVDYVAPTGTAGSCCCTTRNQLSTVNIHTTNTGGGTAPSRLALGLYGLLDAENFVETLNALRSGQQQIPRVNPGSNGVVDIIQEQPQPSAPSAPTAPMLPAYSSVPVATLEAVEAVEQPQK